MEDKPVKKGIYIALIALSAAIFIGAAAYLGNYFLQGKKEADRYNELAQMTLATEAPSTEAATDPTAPTPSEEKPQATLTNANGILLPYSGLYDMNSEMVGWLRIDGTVIDYPVMQTKADNADYYLYRNFDKEESTRGSIYAREQCDVFKPSDNITLYGHTMKDGSMFAALHQYTDKAAWENNSLIVFDNLKEYHVYKIFAVFKTTAVLGEGFSYHQFVNAANEQEFNNFVATCRRLAFYDTGIIPSYGDKLLCLSTCEYTLEDGRLVVAAVRIV